MKFKLVVLCLCIIGFFNISSVSFEIKKIKSFLHCKEIEIKDNNQVMGTITYCKIPLLRWYILYDFYIEPEFRAKGLGKNLLQHARDELIGQFKATRIYIQPGPYEKNIIKPDNYKEKITKLIKLYSSLGFIPVKRFFSKLISIFYWLASIDEDPQYLMVYNVTKP